MSAGEMGRCPLCVAAIVRREENPAAREPYVPRVMWICERGHRVTQPDHSQGER